MKKKILMMTMVFGFFSSHAFAESPDILPGLWEHHMEISSKSGVIEQALEQQKKMMESMPPEQRKMMEAMMAERGMQMDMSNRSVKSCLTQEEINNLSITKVEEGCTQQAKQVAKNRYSITVSCPSQNMSGKGEYTVESKRTFSGQMVMNVNMQGKADIITSKIKGKWLAADCTK